MAPLANVFDFFRENLVVNAAIAIATGLVVGLVVIGVSRLARANAALIVGCAAVAGLLIFLVGVLGVLVLDDVLAEALS